MGCYGNQTIFLNPNVFIAFNDILHLGSRNQQSVILIKLSKEWKVSLINLRVWTLLIFYSTMIFPRVLSFREFS